jgi:hypothetical protein
MKRLQLKLKSPEFKPLYSTAFIVCILLFVAHQLTQRVLFIAIPIADSYLDNFLSTPILLTLLLVERRTLFRYPSNYALSIQEVCMATVFIAVVGEVLFPALSNEFTFDWLDFVFYSAGSIMFHVTINKIGGKSR